MKIIKTTKGPLGEHWHYEMAADGQTVGAVYNEVIKESPFGTYSHLSVCIQRASTMALLASIHMDGTPVPGGFPPDLSRLVVDHIIGTKEKKDGGVYYHSIMIYV